MRKQRLQHCLRIYLPEEDEKNGIKSKGMQPSGTLSFLFSCQRQGFLIVCNTIPQILDDSDRNFDRQIP